MSDNSIPNKQVFMPTWLSLPSTWDASVSEVEMLQGMLYNINCIVQFLEDLQVNYEGYTDTAINGLRAELTAKYDTIIAELKQYHDNAVTALYQYIDTQDTKYWLDTLAQVTRLDKRIDELITYVNSNLQEIRDTHLNDVNTIYKFIESTRQELITFIELNNQSIMEWVKASYQDILDKVDEVNEDGFRIMNPTTGQKDKVEKTVNDVYDALRVFAVTAQEWDNWFIRNDHDGNNFKFLDMSALECDTRSWIVMYGFGYDNIISPATGLYTNVQNALEEVSTNSVVVTPMTGNLTSEQWDELGFDQNDYEVNYPLSAYDHDFKSVHMFDNTQIKTIHENGGYTREYTIGIPKDENEQFILSFDGENIHRSQLQGVDIVSILPDTITSYYIERLNYSMNSNILESLLIVLNTTPQDILVDEIYLRLIVSDQSLIPINISNTNPPKPVPLGNITAEQWDTYFTGHDGNDFKALNMSAYEYDTNSIFYVED